ncbi:hypothetical protein MKZ38_007784 [Zalerion maritima]|uniref:UBC core domain-containing protein n=1 Tax=Zalerion maritima TaxID=339359 RepID=A0AAD5RI69_9PEZI|nr:hypothetical protein MKZ38_007784 [Zalerion maritima]
MGRKQYLADLEAARSTLPPPNVDRVRKGDADSVAFTYTHPDTNLRLDMCIAPSEVADYPKSHIFFIWTDSDSVPANASKAIESLSSGTTSGTISTTIRNLGSSLTQQLSPNIGAHASQSSVITDADGDSAMTDIDECAGRFAQDDEDQEDDDDDGDDDYDFEDDFDVGFGDDDDFGLGTSSPSITPTLTSNASAAFQEVHGASAVKRIKNDLKLAREAGYRVAALSGLLPQSSRSIVSISARVARLGLSGDTLQAWGISSGDYIVLLICITGPYVPFERAKETTATETMRTLEFRVGRCQKHKPSTASATMAFQNPTQLNAAESQTETQGEKDNEFLPIFLSNSISHFMNHDFISMFKIRANLHEGVSWADSTKELETQRRNQGQSDLGISRTSPEGPLGDHLATAGSRQESSLPLVAMELAVHYLVRCTDYCLVCHQKLDSNFEALRPYVCEQPLCLFQYMNLGFGPSVEHEVIDQPYTVDLLLSFCYAGLTCLPPGRFGVSMPGSGSTTRARIRDFPVGLRLEVPMIFEAPTPDKGEARVSKAAEFPPRDTSLDVSFNPVRNEGTMENGYEGSLGVGQWVAILYGRRSRLPSRNCSADPTPSCMIYTGRVSSVLYTKFELKNVTATDHNLSNSAQPYASFESRTSASSTSSTYKAQDCSSMDSLLLPFDRDADDLGMPEKMAVGRILLKTIPAVMTMREYLLSHPHRPLSSFRDLPPPAFGLLRWVISSNRSCITLIDDPSGFDASNDQTTASSSASAWEVVTSATSRKPLSSSSNTERYRIGGMNTWVQFRFLQGSPEKERRFVNALRDSSNTAINTQYPTIFAWHGSNMANWHSIVRTGLDFQDTMNGRAFGNGVYLAANSHTSMSYSQPGESWPHSALEVASTLALCEVVNAPQRFTSTSPHYVVDQIDWIQCRYLFVNTKNAHSPTAPSDFHADGYLQQCPNMHCVGDDGTSLLIPKDAAVSLSSTNLSKGGVDSSLWTGYETDPDDEEDTKFLQDTPRAPGTPVTSFTPGSLDITDLQVLQPPSYATDAASKAIARELKTMRTEIESSSSHELGWYVDLDSVENMFQLIVELHSFDLSLLLAQDMQKAGINSVVLEMRFGRSFPISPPFIRVIRPRFLPHQNGGGGHVTIGGAICMELLTNSGWSPANSLEAVLVQVRAAICSTDPPARLHSTSHHQADYGIFEAVDAYERFARAHGWQVPADIREMASAGRSG